VADVEGTIQKERKMAQARVEKKGKPGSKVVLGYWGIRGLAQPPRLLLNFLGVEFEDRRYHLGGHPHQSDSSAWLNEKHTLGLAFPNLPFLLDGSFNISQSNAILYYIAEKYGGSKILNGNTPEQKAEIKMLGEQTMDFRNTIVRLAYNPEYAHKLPEWAKDSQHPMLTLFSTYLGQKKWLMGDQLSWPDFVLYELLDQSRQMSPANHTFANLEDYCKRFKELPEIKAYMGSADFIEHPINNIQASFA